MHIIELNKTLKKKLGFQDPSQRVAGFESRRYVRHGAAMHWNTSLLCWEPMKMTTFGVILNPENLALLEAEPTTLPFFFWTSWLAVISLLGYASSSLTMSLEFPVEIHRNQKFSELNPLGSTFFLSLRPVLRWTTIHRTSLLRFPNQDFVARIVSSGFLPRWPSQHGWDSCLDQTYSHLGLDHLAL